MIFRDRYSAYLNQQTQLSLSAAGQVTPLMLACQLGKADFARLFILQGADVHARDSLGAAPEEPTQPRLID